MIKTFKCRDTEALFDGRRVARFTNIAAVAIRKLQMVHAATRVETLRVPPQNRLEKLSGDRKGQWSIRVNDQFRVCFVWRDGGGLGRRDRALRNSRGSNGTRTRPAYSTVTDLARLRGLSTSVPRASAV